jgi:hypothetical protein
MTSADGVALLRTLRVALNLAGRAATVAEFLTLADSPDLPSGLFFVLFFVPIFSRATRSARRGNKFRLRADAQGLHLFLASVKWLTHHSRFPLLKYEIANWTLVPGGRHGT